MSGLGIQPLLQRMSKYEQYYNKVVGKFFNSLLITLLHNILMLYLSNQSCTRKCIILGGEEEQRRSTSCLLEIAHWARGMASSQLTDEAVL